ESGARRGDEVVTRILPLGHAEASGLVPVLQPLVSKDGLLTAYPPTNSLVVVDAGANVDRLAALLADLDVPSSERATEGVAPRVNVYHLKYAAADGLVRVLAQLIGQAVGPPPPPEPHGSSLARSSARRAEIPPFGYDGGMGQAPPPTPVSAVAEPAAAGTPAA